ncbi:MAG TPA: hypothetical protein VGE07_18250 [Herpetosiphonaceae bacterium]
MPPQTITHRINGFSLSLSRATSQLEITSDDSADEMMVIEADELCALAIFLRIPHIAAMVDEMSAQLCADDGARDAAFAGQQVALGGPLAAYAASGEEIVQQPGESYESWVARCRAAGIDVQIDPLAD